MKLTDLAPKLYRDSAAPEGEELTIETAGAVEFNCPNGCATHRVIVPLLPRHSNGWTRTGDSLDNVTLRPSIQVIGDCRWHGYVTDGEVAPC